MIIPFIIWRIIDDALTIIDEVALAIGIFDAACTSANERSTNSKTDS
jgi:hypothetical protein